MHKSFKTLILFLALCSTPAFGADYSYTLTAQDQVLDLQTTAGNTYTVSAKLGNPTRLTGFTFSGDGDIILQQNANQRVNIGTTNSDFSGTFTIQDGNLSSTANTSGTITAFGTSTLVLDKAVLMNDSNLGTVTFTNNIKLKGNGGIRVGHNGNNAITLSGTISDFSSTVSGTMNISRDSGVAIINNGNNTYTGGTIIGSTLNQSSENGRLRLGEKADEGSKTPLGTGYVTFGTTDSALNLNGQSVTIYGFKDTTAGYGKLMNDKNAVTLTLNVPTSQTYTYSGAITGTINLVKEGAGSQTFKAANTNGTVTVNTGSMIYDLGATGTGTLGAVTGAGTFQLSSGKMTIDTTATASDALNLNVSSGATLTVNQKYKNPANHIPNTTFTGAGTLVFNATEACRMNFKTANSGFTGTFWFKNGNLSAEGSGVATDGKVQAFGSSTIVLENALLMNAGNSLDYTNNIQLKGNNGARTGFGTDYTLTISGAISDYSGSTGVFNISNDQGKIVINNGNNTYTGGTIVGSSFRESSAVVRLQLGEKADEGSKTPFGTGPVAIRYFGSSEASLDLNGQSVTIYGLNNAATEMNHGILTNSGAACTLTLNVGEGLDYAYGGKITVGNGITLVKTGTGSQTFSGNISGLNIEIQDGTVNTTGSASAASIEVSSGGTLRLVTNGATMDTLSANTITLPEDMILSLEFLDGTPRATDEFQILKQTNPFTYTAEYLTGLLPASQSYWTLRVDGNTVFASVSPSAVPEPATWVLLVLGLAFAGFQGRKFQRPSV